MKEAAEIKAFVEKYKRIPKTCNIGNTTLSPYSSSYLLSKVVNHFDEKECGLVDVRIYNADRHKDTINEKVYRDDYLVMMKNFLKFCHAHNRVPAYITTQKSKTKVSFELYFYCVAKIVDYYQKNKVLPNYCVFYYKDLQNAKTNNATAKKTNSKSTSTSKKTTNSTITRFVSYPHYLSAGCNKLGQCTPYWCGPHSIHQVLKKFGITKYTEKQIASYAGSTTAGTDHKGINTAIAKISKATGIKLTVTWKNFSDMGKNDAERFKAIGKLLNDKSTAILWHISYSNGGESTTGTKFGHYEVIDTINTVTSYVRALNSLGTRKADGSYTGKLQDRKYNVQAYFARNTPGNQPALCIIKKG